MRISFNWLKDYLDISKSPDRLANDLSLFGFTVESFKKIDDDFVLDLEINPNRGDCLSVLGIAREIAAMQKSKLKSQNSKLQLKPQNLDKKINITVSDPKICPHFSARIIDNIKIQDSPTWLQKRLRTYGFRPINNIVDITNYVMIALGQPLHAFDWHKIKNGQMNIHLTSQNEELMTLDGQNRHLPKDTIVIGNEEKLYDLAGIMGGIASEIDDKTQTIVLQSAIFNPVLIRRASKKIGRTTDASYRYERGVDFDGTIFALNLAAKLIKDSCPAAKIGKLIDIQSEKYEDQKIQLDPNKVNHLLGIEIEAEQMQEYLARLSFHSLREQGKLIVTAPSFRTFDVKIWQDLTEEIARIYGYEKIRTNILPKVTTTPLNKNWQKRTIIKDFLKKLGFSEIYSYLFVSGSQIDILGLNIATGQEIANPLSAEMQYLRPTLMPTMLKAMALNPWAPEIAIFEVGKVFPEGQECWQVGLAVSDNLAWLLKDAIEKLSLHKEITNVDKKNLDFYKIRRPVKMLFFKLNEINLPPGKTTERISPKKYREISKFPPTVRDLAFIVDEKIKAGQIQATIEQMSESIFMVEPFDEFRSLKFGQGKKNLAFHIWLQDLEGPVSDKEAEIIFKNIIKKTEAKFQAKLRTK